MRRTAALFRRVAAWVVILGVFAVLSVAVVLPRIAGATPYTVLTGSMRPELPPGTLIVVRPIGMEDISVGDVVTYQLKSGEPTVVTHRVVSTGVGSDGGRILRTQGDANNSPDELPVRPVQLRGELWYSVPYLGYANEVLTGEQRQWAVYGAAVLLFGYAALVWGSAVRARSRRRREVPHAADSSHAPAPA